MIIEFLILSIIVLFVIFFVMAVLRTIDRKRLLIAEEQLKSKDVIPEWLK